MTTSSSPQSFAGVWTALVTPLKQNLDIDWDAFDKLLDDQEAGGVTGVVLAGTTGESPTLTVQEKLSLARRARARLKKTTRVMAGTGDNNTQQSIELSRLAADAGADSLLVVTPPYNKPSLAGLTRHYKMITEAVKVPVCLYHVPGRTAQLLNHEQIGALCEIPGIAAVKEASGDVALFSRVVMKTKAALLSGDDPTYLASLAVGGIGVISVVSNVYPRAMVELTNAFVKGDTARARALHEALLPAIDVMFCEVNPCPAKAALAHRKRCENYVRPPLAEVSDANFKRIAEVCDRTDGLLKRLL
jgi:4-hydroxy-tetrahydrodipicolinate synthase